MPTNLPTVEGVRFLPLVEAPDYAVGDDGSVWTPFGRGHRIFRGWKPLSLYRRPYGARYVVVCLRTPADRDKVVCRYVHRLVMEAFVGPCPEGQEVLHDDNDTANNRRTNLRYGTRVENTADKFRHGTFVLGTQHFNAKLTDDAVREIRRLYAEGDHTQAGLAKRYGVTQSIIGRVVLRKGWKHVPELPAAVEAALDSGFWDGTDDDAGEPRYADEPGEATAFELEATHA